MRTHLPVEEDLSQYGNKYPHLLKKRKQGRGGKRKKRNKPTSPTIE
jgi:hypothetical protein